MASNRSNKLLKDILIYGIGSVGSRFITFLIVPLYAFYILPKDFGYYDISLNIIFLCMPFLTLFLKEGVFRYLVDDKSLKYKRDIVSFAYKVIGVNSLLCCLLYFLLIHFFPIAYGGWILTAMIVMSFYEVHCQVIRGLGYTKGFVVIGILNSLFILLFSYLCVVRGQMGIKGIYISNVLARLCSMLLMEFYIHVFRGYFRFSVNDSDLNKQMLRYSIPLIPNNLCWWIISSSSILFIKHYWGLEYNGIMAMAFKFMSILQIVTFILYQAWQETAFRQSKQEGEGTSFTKIFNSFFIFISALVGIGALVLKMNYGWLIDVNYQSSLMYIFPLFVSVLIYSSASFFELAYLAQKKTQKLLPSIMSGAVVNVVLNFIFIPKWAIYGAVASMLVTWSYIFLYRLVDVRSLYKVNFSGKSYISVFLLMIGGIVFYKVDSLSVNIISACLLLITYFILTKEEIIVIVKSFRKKNVSA